MEKCVFDPFLPRFWSQSGTFKAFWDFQRTKMGHQSKNTCFGIAHGLGSFWRKVIFLPLLDPVDPFGHHLFGLEFAACRSLVDVGTEVWAIMRGGNHKKWGIAGGLIALGIAF